MLVTENQKQVSDFRMSEPDQYRGGGPPTIVTPEPSQALPDQITLTYAKALGGGSGGTTQLKKYAEIVAMQKCQRNVLEIKIKKNQKLDKDAENYPNLSFDDISEVIFEIINIDFEDCIGVDFNTGRYDTREVSLKPQVDSSKYIPTEPIVYKNHEITVRKMLHNVTKVTFKNVPMYVPDEDILHLCGIYGTVVDDKVHWEQQRITTSKKKGVLVSPTRYVHMHLNNGATFNNFYWMEGPMAGDPGRRITVLHQGQKQQCFHCLLTVDTGCRGAGNGRMCAKSGMERGKMSTYMEALKTTTGYETLKVKYMRQLARNYPNLQGEPDLDATLAGDMDNRDIVDDEESEVTLAIVPINPIVEKDREIAELHKKIESLNEKLESLPSLEKGLEDAKAENNKLLNISKQAGRRLSVSRKANEQKMMGLIRSGTNWTEDSAYLACSQAATLNEDDFILSEETDQVVPKKSDFMKKIEDFIDDTDKLQVERFQEMRKLILDQMKKTIKRKLEARGEKRINEDSSENSGGQSKPRVTSPPKI